jgi:hypothetical protein
MMCGLPVGPLKPEGTEFLVPEEFLTGVIVGVGFLVVVDDGALLFSIGEEILLFSIGFAGRFKFPKKRK